MSKYLNLVKDIYASNLKRMYYLTLVLTFKLININI